MRPELRSVPRSTMLATIALGAVGCLDDAGSLSVTPEALAPSAWEDTTFEVRGLAPSAYLDVDGRRLRVAPGLTASLGDAPLVVVAASGELLALRLTEAPALGLHPLVIRARGRRFAAKDPVRVIAPRLLDGGAPPTDAGPPADAGAADAAVSGDAAPPDGDGGVTGPGLPDGGAAPAADAGLCPPRCAASCLRLDCGTCACSDGCPCTFACAAPDCGVTCERGAACDVDAVGTTVPELSCESGATCDFDAEGADAPIVDCLDGTDCTVSVRSADAPEVACTRGAFCRIDARSSVDGVIDCRRGAECVIETDGVDRLLVRCAGGLAGCRGDIVVCNTPCP